MSWGVKVDQFRVEIAHIKMGTTPFKDYRLSNMIRISYYVSIINLPYLDHDLPMGRAFSLYQPATWKQLGTGGSKGV